ncbi:MAG: WYL domain-containing protein [Muribaculaceae bacterium]|nr:WYL domain-containing protein [Muribaculaceae bacterium]MBQ7211878.1 WYL domain-containing protein [Muribaculaceae bacterium]
MARDLLNRYIWIIDTIQRHGRITRQRLNELWKKTPYSNGESLPRRTFYGYRQNIEELFNININCDTSTFEYYIDDLGISNKSVTNWLFNSAALTNILNDTRDISDLIFLEDIPSAREYLNVVIDGLRRRCRLKIDYLPFTRAIPDTDVIIEPYMLKIFRQRWYVAARNVAENRVKTYSLDRFKQASVTDQEYEIPADFIASNYYRDSFGVIADESEVKRVSIKATPLQAKYLRALPLHHSQEEAVHDKYSIFSYKIRITRDFVGELLSYGPQVTVISPPELRTMISTQLEESLSNYK